VVLVNVHRPVAARRRASDRESSSAPRPLTQPAPLARDIPHGPHYSHIGQVQLCRLRRKRCWDISASNPLPRVQKRAVKFMHAKIGLNLSTIRAVTRFQKVRAAGPKLPPPVAIRPCRQRPPAAMASSKSHAPQRPALANQQDIRALCFMARRIADEPAADAGLAAPKARSLRIHHD